MSNQSINYLHGYKEEEQLRLMQQNDTLAKYIYERLNLSDITKILELGCGVGAQMIYLLQKYPKLQIIGVDIDEKQIQKAIVNLDAAQISKERYLLIKIEPNDNSWLELLKQHSIEMVYTVWVLEHMQEPEKLLRELCLKAPKGMRFIATETFHKGLHIVPKNDLFQDFWNNMQDVQLHLGGNANVGLELGRLFNNAGFKVIWHSPFPMLFDKNKSVERKEILHYWKALSLSAVESMQQQNSINHEQIQLISEYFDNLLADPECIFYYAFMQLEAMVPSGE
jgi:SAM-dependent methyltransferase